jgi:exopolysaccharide production protein ExoQ
MNPILVRFEKAFTVFVWMYFTTALYCSSLFISSDAKAISVDALNPYDPLFSKLQLVIYGITFLLLLARWRTSLAILIQGKSILLIILMVLFSCLWSDWPDESWRKGLNAMATGAFGIYTATRFSLREQLKYLLIALGAVTIFCLVFSLLQPGSSIEIGANAGSLRGPMTQKNLLARLMVLTIIVSITAMRTLPRWRWFSGLVGLLGALLLILTGSKTALLVLIVLLLLIPLYGALRWKDTVLIPSLIAVVLIAGSASTLLVSNWESLLRGLGRDPSLSGRTDLWTGAIEKISQRPLLGYGFQAFWQVDGGGADIWKMVLYKPPHAHNGYLNIALDLGLLGLVIFLGSLLIAYIRSIQWVRLYPGMLGIFPMLYVTFMFMYNHTENTIVEHNSIFWAEFVAIFLSLF